MNPREWTLFIISKETGRFMPHWTAPTRAACRRELRSLKNQCGGKLPKGITVAIRKTFDIQWVVQDVPIGAIRTDPLNLN